MPRDAPGAAERAGVRLDACSPKLLDAGCSGRRCSPAPGRSRRTPGGSCIRAGRFGSRTVAGPRRRVHHGRAGSVSCGSFSSCRGRAVHDGVVVVCRFQEELLPAPASAAEASSPARTRLTCPTLPAHRVPRPRPRQLPPHPPIRRWRLSTHRQDGTQEFNWHLPVEAIFPGSVRRNLGKRRRTAQVWEDAAKRASGGKRA